MDAEHIGRRIAYWRDQRGLTQGDFGRLMGQSRRWVQDLEGGRRQADPRLSVLERASQVLHIPLERLVTDSTPARPPATLPQDVVALVDSLHTSPTADADAPLTEIRRRVTYCCQAWAAGHYTAAARDLPGVLTAAHQAAATSAEAAILLSRAYQLTSSLLFKYGSLTRTPAVLAAERALSAAEASGDVVAVGASARRVARGLIHQQRHAAACDYATSTAAMLRSDLEAAGTRGLSTLGMLYLVAAVGATGDGRSPRAVSAATDRMGEAEEVAEHQGEEGADFTNFGPTNVQLHQVDVLLRLDDAWSAVEAARRIDSAAVSGLGREHRARHLVTTARAAALTRRRDDATRDLLVAERLAPQEVMRPSVAQMVAQLMELVPSPGPELRGLAQRCGVST